MVTRRSCIASSRAACVFGGVRLISSARSRLVKIGPCLKRKVRSDVAGSCSSTCVPVMSAGMRSGVNWTRLHCKSSESASVRAISVLARPGVPTRRQWPRREKRDENLVDHFALPDDDARHLGADALHGRVELRDGCFGIIQDRPLGGAGAALRHDACLSTASFSPDSWRRCRFPGVIFRLGAVGRELELGAADGKAGAVIEPQIGGGADSRN